MNHVGHFLIARSTYAFGLGGRGDDPYDGPVDEEEEFPAPEGDQPLEAEERSAARRSGCYDTLAIGG